MQLTYPQLLSYPFHALCCQALLPAGDVPHAFWPQLYQPLCANTENTLSHTPKKPREVHFSSTDLLTAASSALV